MVPGCDGALGDSAVPGAGRPITTCVSQAAAADTALPRGTGPPSPCQGHAAWVPASARLPPRVRRATSQACLHPPHPYPCPAPSARSLDPRGLKPAQSTLLPKASRDVPLPASPPGVAAHLLAPGAGHERRAPLNGAPRPGSWGLKPAVCSSQRLLSCPSACVSVYLGRPLWLVSGHRLGRLGNPLSRVRPALLHPAGQLSCLLPLGVGAS